MLRGCDQVLPNGSQNLGRADDAPASEIVLVLDDRVEQERDAGQVYVSSRREPCAPVVVNEVPARRAYPAPNDRLSRLVVDVQGGNRQTSGRFGVIPAAAASASGKKENGEQGHGRTVCHDSILASVIGGV